MRPHRVKGVHADMRLDEAAQRIVLARLDELFAFMPRAADPAEVEHLHDMRIAAKRLRYVLELTGFCFGPYAVKATKRTRQLQEVIGEIHDIDVTLPRVTALRAEIADDDPAAPGLESIAARMQTQRAALHETFLSLWLKIQREGLRARLEFAVTERPEPPRNHANFTSASVGSQPG